MGCKRLILYGYSFGVDGKCPAITDVNRSRSLLRSNDSISSLLNRLNVLLFSDRLPSHYHGTIAQEMNVSVDPFEYL